MICCCKSPNKICTNTEWSTQCFWIVKARIIYVTSFEGSASRDGRNEERTRRVFAGWVTVLIADSWDFWSFFLFFSFFFFEERFPHRPSRCQHMLVPDGWCAPSCTSVTRFSRAAAERRRRGERATMPWGRDRTKKKKNPANAAADERMMTGGREGAARRMNAVVFLRVFWFCEDRTDRRRWPPCA